MTTYYVRATGNDASAGTSAGAAWLTVQKALNTVAAGDTVWFGAGTYRQVLNCKTVGTSGSHIALKGDVDGVQTGDPGGVIFSAWTTNDKTAPSNTAVFDLANSGTSFGSYYDLSNIQFFAGGGDAFRLSAGVVNNVTCTACGFYTIGGSALCVRLTLPTDVDSGILFDRCYFLGGQTTLTITKSATAPFDSNWKFRNCVFMSSSGAVTITLANTGANTNLPGGGIVSQCTIYGGNVFVSSGSSQSYKYPVRVIGCYAVGANGVILQNNSINGVIVEDWNVLDGTTPRATTVPLVAGPNSKSGTGTTYAPMWESFADTIIGNSVRHYLEPRDSSPLLGFIPQSTQMSCGVPGTAADDATVGTTVWTNPGNATALDGSNAVAVIALSSTSHYLKLTNFAWTPAVPAGATITQVTVQIYASKSGSGTLAANSIKLTKDGTTFPGSDNSATLSTLTGSLVESQVGGSNDLWGLTLSQADVTASTFGVGISWKDTSGVNAETVNVDYVRIYVEYTTATAPAEHTVDFTNRLRPAGGNASIAVGAMDRGNTAVKETSTVHTGSNAIKLAGPSYHDFQLAVDAAATTITAYMRYDGSYGGSTLPTMQVVNGTECGVSNASVSQVGASNTWEQVSLTFTPTAKGVITVRFSNLSTATAGNVYVDTFAVA